MKIRDVGLVASSAIVSAAITLLVVGRDRTPSIETQRAVRATPALAAKPGDRTVVQNTELALQPRNGTTAPAARADVELVRSKLATVEGEKRELQKQLKQLEKELAGQQGASAAQARDEFDVASEEWKELAKTAQLKYRLPCMLPEGYTMSAADLDELGLSPDDGDALTEAHYRSNGRIWATIRPLCVKEVGTAEVAELLGPMNCLDLVEKVAMRRDLQRVLNAKRHVAEVHAGLQRPKPEPSQDLTDVYMAMTTEAQRFEADLANSFGPEEAKRLRQSMHCVMTTRPSRKRQPE